MTFFEWFYKNLILSGVFVLILLLSVVIIKYFAPDIFAETQKFYKDNFLTDTKISEVLDGEF
jgi:hypothetical protein